MKKWSHILWGSPEEEELKEKVFKLEDADPDELTIENAYKTRWIWYHTILGLLLLMVNIIMLAIFTLLAIKL